MLPVPPIDPETVPREIPPFAVTVLLTVKLCGAASPKEDEAPNVMFVEVVTLLATTLTLEGAVTAVTVIDPDP